jgi:hypothetical protein
MKKIRSRQHHPEKTEKPLRKWKDTQPSLMMIKMFVEISKCNCSFPKMLSCHCECSKNSTQIMHTKGKRQRNERENEKQRCLKGTTEHDKVKWICTGQKQKENNKKWNDTKWNKRMRKRNGMECKWKSNSVGTWWMVNQMELKMLMLCDCQLWLSQDEKISVCGPLLGCDKKWLWCWGHASEDEDDEKVGSVLIVLIVVKCKVVSAKERPLESAESVDSCFACKKNERASLIGKQSWRSL